MEPEILRQCNCGGPIGCMLRRVGLSLPQDRMKPFIAALLIAALLLMPGAVRASQQGVGAMKNWKTADDCARQAQAAFPDFTAEANAKRDARLKECLEGKNMPAREPLSPGRSGER